MIGCLPRMTRGYPRMACWPPGTADSSEPMDPSLEWAAHSVEPVAHSLERMSHSKERVVHSLERMTHSKERMTRSKERMVRSNAGRRPTAASPPG